MTRTDVSVVVMAPVLTVCSFVGDILNIARGLPGVCSVHVGPAQTMSICYRDRASAADGRVTDSSPGRFRIDQQRQRIEWEIYGSVRYRGTLTVFGDSNVSRLQSKLCSDLPSVKAAARDLHTRMMHRIAHAAESGDLRPPPQLPSTGVKRTGHGQHDGRSAAALGKQGLVRESWTVDAR